jgi:trigger factor
MSYKIEDINTCTKKLIFNIESVDLSGEINEALKKKQESVTLKGFRPGKAPLAMVQKLYGPQVHSDALGRYVYNEFYDAVEKEGLSPVGYPVFNRPDYSEEKKSLGFEAIVELFPAVEVKNYDNYEFTRTEKEFKNEELEAAKKSHLEPKAQMEPIADQDATVANGHFAVINFEGEKEDGSRPDNMKGEEFPLEIGSGSFIPGFEEGLIGAKNGESRTIEVTFPEDYQAEDLRGAKVKFHTKVLEIKEKNYPEFDDELAKELRFDSVADFEEKTKKRIIEENKRAADEKLHQEILEKLVADNPFDLPSMMVNNQIDGLKKETEGYLKNQGFTESMMEDYHQKWSGEYEQKANFQVRSGLILNKLAENYGIEAKEEDLESKYEMMAATYNMPVEEIKNIYSKNDNLKKNLLYAVKEEKTFTKFKENIKVKS